MYHQFRLQALANKKVELEVDSFAYKANMNLAEALRQEGEEVQEDLNDYQLEINHLDILIAYLDEQIMECVQDAKNEMEHVMRAGGQIGIDLARQIDSLNEEDDEFS